MLCADVAFGTASSTRQLYQRSLTSFAKKDAPLFQNVMNGTKLGSAPRPYWYLLCYSEPSFHNKLGKISPIWIFSPLITKQMCTPSSQKGCLSAGDKGRWKITFLQHWSKLWDRSLEKTRGEALDQTSNTGMPFPLIFLDLNFQSCKGRWIDSPRNMHLFIYKATAWRQRHIPASHMLPHWQYTIVAPFHTKSVPCTLNLDISSSSFWSVLMLGLSGWKLFCSHKS